MVCSVMQTYAILVLSIQMNVIRYYNLIHLLIVFVQFRLLKYLVIVVLCHEIFTMFKYLPPFLRYNLY